MNKINEAHGLDRAPTATEQKFNAPRGRWLAVYPDGRRIVAREHDAETLATPGLRWYAVADYGDEYETIGWPIVPSIDVAAIEARANAADKGPWRSTWPDPVPADDPNEMIVESLAPGLSYAERMIVGTLWHDGPHAVCGEANSAFIAAARTDVPALTSALCDAYTMLNLYADRATQRSAEYLTLARDMDARGFALRAATLESHTARRQTSELAEAVRRERDARAAWLASLPDGSCGNPPPASLLEAEEATGEALRSIEGAK